MSDVTRRDPIRAHIMEPLLDGGYRDADVKKYAWRCDGCGLVWAMKHQAVDCESRGHVAHYMQRYVYGPIVNGQPTREKWYDRDAIGREKVTA